MSNEATGIPMGKLTDPAAINAALEEAERIGFLLSPVSYVSDVPQLHAVVLNVIKLDSQGSDFYQSRQFCESGEIALTSIGLEKLWGAFGGWDARPVRDDDGSDPLFRRITAAVVFKGLDGRNKTYFGTKEIDLRPGSALIKSEFTGDDGVREKQLVGAQARIGEQCETKAKLRAVRKALGVAQKYNVKDIDEKPFIIPTLVTHLDLSNPRSRALAEAAALGIEDAVFGPRPGLTALPAAADDRPANVTHDGEVIDVPAEAMPAGEVPPPPADSPAAACGCPCGCTKALTQELADHSMEKLRAHRCRDCFPTPGTFDLAMHKGRGSLGIPDRPDLTVDRMADLMRGAA